MTEAILGACAYFTLISVSICAFLCSIAGIIIYRASKQLDRTIAEIPAMASRKIGEYLRPYQEKHLQEGDPALDNEPIFPDTDTDEYEAWLNR